ncbi:LA2681 family HEPN domain-containing protein [Variovorax sp. RB2P76]|uniref:LA2681 family HEPN domain-containing protein n=1 Tax=Variovorax sp. RB2P76 TaxID=3443736 RepID=UPI003F447BE7
MPTKFSELSKHLNALLDASPADAVQQAREMDLNTPERLNLMSLQAAILVDGGVLTKQSGAIDQGLALYRELYEQFPTDDIAYNLANALVAAVGPPPNDPSWLDHRERTFGQRAEARRLYWQAIHDLAREPSLVTQAWTNLASQFSGSYRLGEAHDARLAALQIDPENGVAASTAARELMWLFEQGGCSDLTRVEAILLAKIAVRHQDRLVEYAGAQAAKGIKAFADELGDPPPRSPHTDPFITWVEQERLTLSPVVELVDPSLGKLDWLVLPGIRERESGAGATPPPIFAMFNLLKGDFILARDLAWRAMDESVWPTTGRYADTLDFATYGPDASALVLSHRTALDLLDKVAVTANHYFELGQSPDKVYFGKLWRGQLDKTSGMRPLTPSVDAAIRSGAKALYGLVELADDYDSKNGILRPQKDLRNAGTHRFVVLHDFGDPAQSRQAPEVEHLTRELFTQEVLRALRVARSAIQTFALAVAQHERDQQRQSKGLIGHLVVPDHDWIRGRDD